MKWFRFLTLMVIALMNVMSFLYFLKLIFPFSKSMNNIVLCSTIVLILVALLLTTVDIVASKSANHWASLGISSAIYKTYNVISVVLFIIYFIVFVITTNDIERGSATYMAKMFPGLIPIVSGALLNILSRI